MISRPFSLQVVNPFSYKYQPPFASSDTNPDWPQHLYWLFVQGKLNLTSLLRFPNDRAGCFSLILDRFNCIKYSASERTCMDVLRQAYFPRLRNRLCYLKIEKANQSDYY